MCRQKDVKAVDLRFVDLFGAPQHFSIPVNKLNEDSFDDGFGFDDRTLTGSSAAFQGNLLAIPRPDTAFVDPFAKLPTLVMFCNVQDCATRQSAADDPRALAQRADAYLKSTGIADQAFFGPEIEFFVFDNDCTGQGLGMGAVENDALDKHHTLSREQQKRPNLEQFSRDALVDIRNEMMHLMLESGVDVNSQRAEKSTSGQAVMELSHSDLIPTADAVVTFKYVVKKVAQRHGKTATFMPKPSVEQRGSGMRTHLSLWKDEQPLFAGSGYAGLSETAVHAIGGLLKHSKALLAFTNPTTNSYKRLAPGAQAPVHLVYSLQCRTAACRIPAYSSNPKSKRIEFCCPDPSCNPYIAFSAMLMAMVDGVQNKISPGDPVDGSSSVESGDHRFPETPTSLVDALDGLEADHAFLLRGDVFTTEIIERWVRQKRLREVDELRRRPHPYEFSMYYDV